MRKTIIVALCCLIFGLIQLSAHTHRTPKDGPLAVFLQKPAHVFDGTSSQLHDGWVVLVRGEKIDAVGPAAEVSAPADAKVIEMPGTTLMPGLIEAHSHVLL